MVERQILTELVKAGGVSALSIGVMYLLYRGIIRLGIFPRLKQWQAFSLLCILAVFVFIIVLVTLEKSEGRTALIPGELPPDNHFQMDAYAGLFCESRNVRDPFVTFFDEVEIYLDKCTNGVPGGSRAYRVEWTPESPTSVSPQNRHNYYQCFVSDFATRAPLISDQIDKSFNEHRDLIPCQHYTAVFRAIRLSYNNIRNESQRAAFSQFFNIAGSKSPGIRQVPLDGLAESTSMKPITLRPDGTLSERELLNLGRDFDRSGSPPTN